MSRDPVWWFHLKCPVCGHVIGLHSGPNAPAGDDVARIGTCHGGPTDGGRGLDCAAERGGKGRRCGWYEVPLDDYAGPAVQLGLFR